MLQSFASCTLGHKVFWGCDKQAKAISEKHERDTVKQHFHTPTLPSVGSILGYSRRFLYIKPVISAMMNTNTIPPLIIRQSH